MQATAARGTSETTKTDTDATNAGAVHTGAAITSATDTRTTDASATHTDATDTGATETRALAADLFALLVYLNKSCSADLFAAMGELELSITQLKLLHQLELAGRELTVKQAAESVPLSLPAISRTVEDLVQRGILERHEDVQDRRMKRVGLTDAGRRVIRKVSEARLAGLEQFTSTLSDDERHVLGTALQTMLLRTDLASCRPDQLKA